MGWCPRTGIIAALDPELSLELDAGPLDEAWPFAASLGVQACAVHGAKATSQSRKKDKKRKNPKPFYV